MSNLLNLPFDLLKVLIRFCGHSIYEFRNLCTHMSRYIPKPLVLAYTVISESDIDNFANTFIKDGKQINDVIFNITALYGINPIKLFNVFNCVKINKFTVFSRYEINNIENTRGMEEEIMVSRCKFPRSEITIFDDAIIGETYLRRVNSHSLIIKNCDLTIIGLNYLPLLKISKLDITNLKYAKQFLCSISEYLQELIIDDTFFSRFALFSACRSNLKVISFPYCADSYEYIKLFPDSLKTVYIHNCKEFIEDTVTEFLNADMKLYITEISTVYDYIEKIYPTRNISDIDIDAPMLQYVLVKDDLYIYIIR